MERSSSSFASCKEHPIYLWFSKDSEWGDPHPWVSSPLLRAQAFLQTSGLGLLRSTEQVLRPAVTAHTGTWLPLGHSRQEAFFPARVPQQGEEMLNSAVVTECLLRVGHCSRSRSYIIAQNRYSCPYRAHVTGGEGNEQIF